MKQHSRVCINNLKKGEPPVKPEASVGKNPEYHHHVMSGKIPGDGTFHNNQLILLEWCLDMELIQIYIQLKAMKGEPQHHHHQWHDY